MSKKIFFGNYKGGVAKTTTVFELGALLAERHNKTVLLIDLDPQCSLSKICAKTSNVKLAQLNVEETLNFAIELYSEYVNISTKLDFLEDKVNTNFETVKASIKNIANYSKRGGRLDYIPTVLDMKNSRLNDISDRLSEKAMNVMIVAKFLNDIDKNNEYDYILFDCPPTSNILIQSVFLASDYYLIPTVGDEISSDGVADYITEIESTYLKYAYDNNVGGLLLKKYFGQKPELIGVLETIYKSRRPSPANLNVLETLDKSITAIGVKSKVTGTIYVAENRNHIFKAFIRHLDNRSNPNNYGIPITISNGEIHDEYVQVAEALVNLV
ncbi:ParA family protein [Paenibacillus sp. FSL K6-2524]|uniref:ParA family protein n=1 Tax=Paenibacillus sp. FSL K6-2524 TaxID=2954516 RepID=UPI0030F87DD5